MDSVKKAMIEAATKRDKRADYLHSSGYGRVQSGEKIGTGGGQTFQERQELKRKFVQGYGDSKLGAQADGGWRARAMSGGSEGGSKGYGFAGKSDSGVVSARQRNPIAERRASGGARQNKG